MTDNINKQTASQGTPASDESESAAIKIEVECVEKINFASAQNLVPIIHRLRLVNKTPQNLKNIKLCLESSPPFVRIKTWNLDCIAADDDIEITGDLDPFLNMDYLTKLNESEQGHFDFKLYSGEKVIATQTIALRVLARNEWGGLAAMEQILAAFISPNDPAIAPLLKEASKILESAGYSGAMDGYQSKDRQRVWLLAAAIWSAATALNLSYSEPPKSFERGEGQKVRDPSHIVGEELATCLDTSLMLAAALEQAGLHSVIVFLRGHAFTGVWLQETTFRTTVEHDPTELRKAIALHELIVFETTLICHRPAVGFEQAITEAKKHLSESEEHNFDRAIDIARCRNAGIRPLSTGGEPKRAEVPKEPIAPPPPPPPPDMPGDPDDETPKNAQGRIARWQRKLLDLSLRNRMLNFNINSKQAVSIICPDIPKVENMLAAGKNFSIISLPDENPAGERDNELHHRTTGKEIEVEYAREVIERKELCAPLPGRELTNRLTALYRKAKSDMNEGGTNTLFLAVGFLRWKKMPEDKRAYRAPLLLLPVKLTRKSAISGYKISHHEEEVRFNATLLQFLERDFHLQIPRMEEALPTDESGIDVSEVFKRMRHAVREVPGFEVSEEAVLSTFSFAKYLMWKDLVDRTDELRNNRLVKRLIDDPEHSTDSGNDDQFPEPSDIDCRVHPKDILTPLPADSSQLTAVLAAEQDRDFVIIGPPGTGKSQTIANIIAHCLAKRLTVLFVAEKAAALDVVHRRLRQHGLGDACLELHSNKADRAQVLRQFGAAWSRASAATEDEWIAVTDRLKLNRDKLNDYVKALHTPGSHGFSVFDAVGIVASGQAPFNLSYENIEAHDNESFYALQELARQAAIAWKYAKEGDALDSIQATGWSQAWRTGFIQNAEAVITAAEEASYSAGKLADTLGLPADNDISAARRMFLERFAAITDNTVNDDFRPALMADMSVLQQALAPLTECLENIATAKTKLSGAYAEEEIVRVPIEDIDRSWREAITRIWPFSVLGRYKIRKLLATYAEDGKQVIDPAVDIPQIRILQQNLSSLADTPLAIAPVFNGSATAPDVIRDWVAKAADFCAIMEELSAAGGSEKISEILAAPDAGNSDIVRITSAFAAAMGNLHKALSKHTAHAGGAPELGELTELILAFRKMLGQETHLAARVRWAEIRRMGMMRGLGPLLDSLETGKLEQGAENDKIVEENFRRAYFRWWLPLALDKSSVLRTFQGWEYEDVRQTFCRLEDEAQKLASAQVRLALTHDLPAKDRVPRNSELGALRHQLNLKRPSMAIRELVANMPTVFTKLTPCVLMSPLSIAQYLPTDHQSFDMVIFDEASQITTWDAIGSIARGRRTIIVGDPKQLPPTNFFGRANAEDDDDLEFYEQDMPSILDEVAVAGVRTHQLSWHYRSRDEGLIAFSNRHYYNGSLVTFPAPTTEGEAVNLHRLNGIFARGKARTNRVEADAIVESIVKRMKTELAKPEDSRQTFGVVTFNIQQQELILDLLDEARRQDPSLEWFFEDEREEPTITKNLENIQGDERDVMMFSITFGPDDAGRITMNFGALNREGGEKRLNVAITRARAELHVFASFDSDQIDLMRTSAVGVKHLKQFLDYANRGAIALAAADEGCLGPAESPFEEAVATALTLQGWEVRHQIGVSGFRIDLGIVHPNYAGAYIAGIECDGYTYHRSATARDRDRIRENILTGLGWNILRVWSIDWFQSPVEVIKRLCENLEQLLRQDMEKRAAQTADVNMQEVAHSNIGATDRDTKSDETAGEIDPDRFEETTYTPILQNLITDIVVKQGPILLDLLVRAVAKKHGWQRVGRRIRDRVIDCLSSNEVHKDPNGSFVWQAGSYAEVINFRDKVAFSLKERPKAEILGAIKANPDILNQNDPVDALARKVGVGRLTTEMRNWLEECLESANSVNASEWGENSC